MNHKKSVGVNLEGGYFDSHILRMMESLIRITFEGLENSGDNRITRTRLAESLEMDRWRLTRLLKALEITDLF